MNRILRVVGGPLKGAEIALVAGTRVKVGSGDGCDVLVADPTLGKTAFELDVGEDEVTIVTPDGTAKTMLDFEAREFGSSAFAIGPAEGAWQEIVWAEKRDQGSGIGDQEEGSGEVAGEVPPKADPLKGGKDEKPGTEDGEKPSRVSRFLFLVLLAVVVILVLLALFWYLRCYRGCCEGRGEAVAPRVTLAEVATRYGLSVSETNGQTVVRGDLKTRAERLAATAAAFQAKPGAEVDIVDDESLYEAADALLGLVAQGTSLRVVAATNRVVVLKGSVASADFLRATLAALANDVSGMAKADCSAVACGGKPLGDEWLARVPQAGKSQSAAVVPAAVASVRVPVRADKPAVPRLPVCGIVMTPYPCLILKNGSRISEGGTFGGYTVMCITADSLTLSDGVRTFEWKP